MSRLQLRLDGFYSHYDVAGGVPDITIQATNGTQTFEGRTDRQGRFSIMAPAARYEVKPQLPPSLVRLFDQPITAIVDRCSGEVSVPVATVPLRGTVRFA